MKPEEFVNELSGIFQQHSSATDALAMSQYMKNLFLFYGIKKPLRSQIIKTLISCAKEEMKEEWILKTVILLWKKE